MKIKELIAAIWIVLVLGISALSHATVSSETTKVSYTCNGALTTYAYTFKIFEDDDLLAVKALTSTGTETALVLNTDYTVTGAGNPGGGNVVLTAASKCAAGYSLTLLRNMDLTQETDYVDGEAFSATSFENALDRLTIVQQQHDEALDRALKNPVKSTAALPGPVKNNYIGWNDTATALENKITALQVGATAGTADNFFYACASAADQGATTDSCSIASLLASIGTSKSATIVLAHSSSGNTTTYTIGQSADWSAYTNVTFNIVPGVVISHGAFTLNLPNPDAGVYQWLTGTGAVTFSGKLTQGPYPQWFGTNTVPGTTDMTLPITYALNSLSDGGTVYFPADTYLTTTTITPVKGVNLIGIGEAIIYSDAASVLVMSASTVAANTVLSTTLSVVVQSAKTLTAAVNAETAGVQTGDLISINDTSREWQTGAASSMYGELNVVASVSGTTVVPLLATATSYPAAVPVVFYRPWTNLRIENITFRRKTKTSNTATALSLATLKNALVKNVTFDGFGASGLSDGYCFGNTYTDIKGIDLWYAGVSLGYGIQTNNSTSIMVNDSKFTNVRRGVDWSGSFPTRFSSVNNSTVFGSPAAYAALESAGFGSHSTSEYNSYNNCTTVDTYYGMNFRGNYETVKNFTVIGANYVFVSAYGKGRNIDGVNTGKITIASGTPYYGGFFYSEASGQNLSGPQGIGNGVDSVFIKNVDATYNTVFIDLTDGVLTGTQFFIDNSVAIYRNAGTPYFISIANQSVARAFTFFINGVKNISQAGSLTAYVNSVGTNATLNMLTPEQGMTISTLSAAQVNALRATPITLVAAQGANTWTELVSAVLSYDYTGAAFTVAADEDLVIEYSGGTDTTASIETAGFLDQADDEIRFYPTSLTAGADIEATINKALRIINTGAGETADGGTSTLRINTTYRVHRLNL